MKKLLLRTFKLLLAIVFPGLLLAQQNPDYMLHLNAGEFTPPENVSTLKNGSDIFQKSAFADQHYLVLQFKTLPSQTEKVQLQQAGIQLIDYLPNLAYTAAVAQKFPASQFQKFKVRSVFQLNASQKTVPALLKKVVPAHAVNVSGFADLSVITFGNIPAAKLSTIFQKLQITVLEEMPAFRTFTLRVPQQNILKLIDQPFVQWVEPIDAPNTLENLPGRSLHRVNVLQDGPRNLQGTGINVGIWDGGSVSPHLDFTPTASRLHIMETGTASSHATHVAGTIGGRGIINPKARGMAPKATLYSYNYSGNIPNEMANAIPTLGLNISNHSYGSTQTCGVNGAGVAYSTTSRATDLNLNNFPWHLHVHSAGNSQMECTGGWSTITGSGKTAKNNLLVANITSTQNINSSSSFGPVHDGRVKPEISGLGTSVLSTYTPLNTYGTITGTSMSTPGVAGSVALVVERYKQLHNNQTPVSTLIKNLVCNTAQDLGNPGPDYKFGFGRINALAAVKTLEQNRFTLDSIATGTTRDISITVPSSALKLNVMLTWNDPAGTANASVALVNNLDLKVINGATTILPWVLDKMNPSGNATRAIDNISNIEQVTIDNPSAGNYTLRVNGEAVPTGANQPYALTWEIIQPGIEVIYPNGSEAFSPGSQEVITWENPGVSGNQTIQYSINNGSTWTTISSSVSAATTRYTWTVPAGLNTSTALIRISSGSLSDQSDATFKILGTPGTLNAVPGLCGGSLNFSWPAVTNASHYDLLQLDASTGQWVTFAANITGTSYAAANLTPNASLWFTLVAKNNLTNAVSERALAINRTITTSSALTLGNISGQTSLCAGSQNVTYSVPAATGVSTYTWTVPTGATIVSGQGTTNLVVNYPATAVSGNISVIGSNGPCQSATKTLAISAGNAVPPPTNNGNLTACDFNPSPKLVATATVPAGFSVVWYDAPTGGNLVTEPALNQVGTVTYYAASRNNAGNCESTTRTPVILTINPVSQATISASATAVCSGGEVTLTASPGNTYFWNTGATTQSIKVSQPGNYSVSVTQNTGCSSTSAPTTIAALPNPELTLTAAPHKALLPGLTTTLTATPNAPGNYTYAWYQNGTLLPGKTGTTLPVTIDETGEYSVQLTTTDGCAATSNKLAISDSVSSQLFIYPNPNNGTFQIRFQNTDGRYDLQVYDAKGSRVFLQSNQLTRSYQKLTVDMRAFGSGVYWLMLLDENGKKTTSGRIVIN